LKEKKVLMSLSGGMDSAVLLSHLIKLDYQIECVNFFYLSNHNKYENEMAKKIAKFYSVKLTTIDVSSIFVNFKSNLLGGVIPEGHYQEDSMKLTVIPGRNLIFSAILSGLAESKNIGKIALGIHSGDHVIYPDARQEFAKSLDTTIYLSSDKKVEIIAPFINIDKTKICKIGLENNVPFQLTRTCYANQQYPCGKCGSCNERLEAFSKNNATDPVIYQFQFSPKTL